MDEVAHWKTALSTVDRVRADIVASGDEARARELIRLAGLFARSQVNTSVSTAERWFTAYVSHGKAAKFHARYWEAWESFVNSLPKPVEYLRNIGDLSGAWEAWDLAIKVPGLGPVKASMTVALLGGRLGCVDRHIYAKHLGTSPLAQGF
jgi:hypothetical protein